MTEPKKLMTVLDQHHSDMKDGHDAILSKLTGLADTLPDKITERIWSKFSSFDEASRVRSVLTAIDPELRDLIRKSIADSLTNSEVSGKLDAKLQEIVRQPIKMKAWYLRVEVLYGSIGLLLGLVGNEAIVFVYHMIKALCSGQPF